MRTVLLLLTACGRLGFDPSGDGGSGDGDGGVPISLVLPAGGTFDGIAVAPDGAWYASSSAAGAWRSDDHQTWTRCGAAKPTGMAVTTAGTVYAADTDVLASTDRCATWTPTAVGKFTYTVGADGNSLYALVDNGIRARVAGGSGWVAVPTPGDGNPFVTYAATANLRIFGTDGAGLVVMPNAGGTTRVTAGLSSQFLGAVAASATRQYAITKADGVVSQTGGISCSVGSGGVTWTVCHPSGGSAIAVDPTDDQHVVAAPYDTLLQTTNAFGSVAFDKQQYAMDEANVFDLQFTPSGEVLAATASGVYYAPDRNLVWEARMTGLSAWNVLGISRDGDDVYLATQGGVMRSANGDPFTLSTKCMVLSTRTENVTYAPDGSLIAPGRWLWRSIDRGATWSSLFDLDAVDGYFASSMAFDGMRAFVGTDSRVLVADPPWTAWTPRQIAGASRVVNHVLVSDGLWAATASGLFVSHDQALTFEPVPGMPAINTRFITALPDGGLVIAVADGTWISDPARTTWTHRGPVDLVVFKVAVIPDAIVAATDRGAMISRDRGASWSLVPGSDEHRVRDAIYDAGSLVIATRGDGLLRVPLP